MKRTFINRTTLLRTTMSLAVVMLTSLSMWAADITQNTAVVINSGNKATYNNKSVAGTVPASSYAGNNATFTSAGAIVVDGIELNLTIDGFNTDYSEALSPRSGIALANGATLHLTVNGTNTLKAGFGGAGISVPAGCTLEITAASTGTLNATGGKNYGGGAGIGSLGNRQNTQTQAYMIVPQGLGTIIINGGTINAQGGTWYVYYDKAGGAAGIGSGEDSGLTMTNPPFGDNSYVNNITGIITINGGTVNATGGFAAAGIGGGNTGTVKTITINGGTVTANGSDGAAIGLGYNAAIDGTLTCPTIVFTGGTTTANGNIGYGKVLMAGHDIDGKVTIGAGANVTCSGSIKPFDAATIPANSYIDADGNRQTAQKPTSVLNMYDWTEGWWVVDQYSEYNERVVVTGTVNLIINDGVTLNAKKGIQVHRGNTLNIYTQQSGTGLIKATGDSGNAGIGGGYVNKRSGTFEDKSCGTINIYGGTIEARGGSSGAGIGCGYIKSKTTDGGTINIYGGTVTAWGNDASAGIGSGELSQGNSYTNPQTVHIYGGRVTAYNGGSGSAAIGKGRNGKDGTTTLGWTNATDAIYANGYSGTVTLTSDFMLENSETAAERSNISGRLMVTPVVVSFAAGGGSGQMNNVKTAYGRHYLLPSCTFTPPTDKEFDRWYVDGISYNVGDEIVVTENTQVKAMWKEAPRTVQFNLKGHGDAVTSQVVDYDGMAAEPAAPSAVGYTFGGWFKEQACVNRWNFATDHVTHHTTLYAKWTENAYSIAYNLNGGVETTSNPLSYTVEDADITLAAPVKTGYTFTGWTYEGQDEPVLSVKITKGSTGNKSFTAHWQIAQFTITFDTGGGTAVDPITQDYNTAVSWPSASPKKAKHIFIGWENLPSKMPGENTTVNAIWVSVYPEEAREATCSDAGMIACYYAYGDYYREESDGITYTKLYPSDYKTPALGHIWTNPTWTWDHLSSDGKLAATLLLTCSRCSRPDHSLTNNFTTEVTTEPTVDTDGVLTYTANIEVDGTNYSDTYDEVIPRTGVAAMIGTTEYPYLKTALAAANDGDVVTLCQDVYDPSVTYGTPISLHKSVILDMNEHSVYAAGLCLDNSLTLKNGTFTGRINNFSTGSHHTLTLDNATLNCEGFYDSEYDFWQTGIEWLATDIAVTNGSVMYIAGSTYLGGGDDDGFNLTIDDNSSVVLSNAILGGYNNTRVRSEFAKYLPAGYAINDEGKVEYDHSVYGGFVTLQPNSLNLAAKLANGAYWTTYYNGTTGYKIDVNENACAYTATVSGNTVTLHKLGKVIPAATAVILVCDDNGITMTASSDVAEYFVSNDLHGVDVVTPTSSLGTGSFYVLGNKNSHFGFHEYTGTSMPARKAYLMLPSAARQLMMVFEGEEATGITNHLSPITLHPSPLFDLQGRQVAQPSRGLYIENGKKVVIK